MDPSTDAVVADVRDKRLSIDRRIDQLNGRLERMNPRHLPWQAWFTRAWPFIAAGLATLAWRQYRYRHRFMRLP